MINIIGSGPIGSYTAKLLAKNRTTTIYEQKKEVGKPIQCTGILTHTIKEIMPIKKEWTKNKVYNARIYAPNKKKIELKFKDPNIIINRELFDKYLLEKALDNGAEIKFMKRFEKGKMIDLETRRKKEIKGTIIGCDGPLSNVSKHYKLGFNKCLKGIQATIKIKNDNCVEFYPHIGTYSWAVPENETTMRVGVAADKDVLKTFNQFIKKYKGRVLEKQGGLIPLHNHKRIISREKVFLAGDSAGHIKNTTGGGIIPGLMVAEELKKAILNENDYESLWRRRIGKQLLAHKIIRDVMNKFKDEEWNELITNLNNAKTKNALEEISRDEPIRLGLKVLLNNMWTVKHIKKLF